MRGTTVLPLAAMVVVLLHAASRAAGAGGGGDGSCERSCGSMKLPYPFGFSSGCTIRLGCDDDVAWLGDARELGLHVRNVTARGIILDLIPDCSRAFSASITALFSNNYAPDDGNILVVSSCSPAAQGARVIYCSTVRPERYAIDSSSSHCAVCVPRSHPDRGMRPSIRQAVNVLRFEAPLPSLPARMPVATYGPPANPLSFGTLVLSSANGR